MADDAAARLVPPADHVARIQELSNSFRSVQCRLVAINLHCARTEPHVFRRTKPAAKKSSLVEKLRKSKHFLVPCEMGFRCSKCRRVLKVGRLTGFLKKPCKPVQTDVGVVADVHASHTSKLRITHGVLWCDCCGGWAQNRSDKTLHPRSTLLKPCKEPTQSGVAALKRLQSDPPMHPHNQMKIWPDGTAVPVAISKRKPITSLPLPKQRGKRR